MSKEPPLVLAPIQQLVPSATWTAVTWACSVVAVVSFAGTALLYARRYLRTPGTADFTTDIFLSARRTQPSIRIAWSFFAGTMGAWAVATPASLVATTGILGLVSYAVSSGIPPIMLAFVGDKVQALLPRPLSLSDFVLWRYGRAAQVLVTSIVFINCAFGLVSEYSTMGSIFRAFVKSVPHPMVVLIGAAAITYSAYGGLLISIITDQLQGVFAAVLMATLAIYLGVSFPRGAELPPFPYDSLGVTAAGYSTLFTLPVSMVASSFFSEAMWQRVWAAESRAALRSGSVLAALLIVISIGFLGLTGLLSTWAYAPVIDPNGPTANLLTFYVLGDRQYSWLGIVAVVLTITMNMSAVDSGMNALTVILSANFFRSRSLSFTRYLVISMNVPIMLAGTFGLPVLNLFLTTNLLTTGGFLPLVSGLLDPSRDWISGYAMVFATATGAVALTVYGAVAAPIDWASNTVLDGIVWAWWSNQYDYRAFLVPLLASVAALVAWCLIARALFVVAGVEGQGFTPAMRAVVEAMAAAERAEQDELARQHRAVPAANPWAPEPFYSSGTSPSREYSQQQQLDQRQQQQRVYYDQQRQLQQQQQQQQHLQSPTQIDDRDKVHRHW